MNVREFEIEANRISHEVVILAVNADIPMLVVVEKIKTISEAILTEAQKGMEN